MCALAAGEHADGGLGRVVTLGTEMFVVIRYSRAQFDGGEAAAFATAFSRALLGG